MLNKEIKNYPVIFSPAEEGGFNVSFPNFPGCVTFGESFEEAQKMAQEVLQLWIETNSEIKEEKITERIQSPIISSVSVTI